RHRIAAALCSRRQYRKSPATRTASARNNRTGRWRRDRRASGRRAPPPPSPATAPPRAGRRAAPSILLDQRRRAETALGERPQRAARRRIGEQPVEPDDAPFDAVADADDALRFLDVVDHGMHAIVAEMAAGDAIAARDIFDAIAAVAQLAHAVEAGDLEVLFPISVLRGAEHALDAIEHRLRVALIEIADIGRETLLGRVGVFAVGPGRRR